MTRTQKYQHNLPPSVPLFFECFFAGELIPSVKRVDCLVAHSLLASRDAGVT